MTIVIQAHPGSYLMCNRLLIFAVLAGTVLLSPLVHPVLAQDAADEEVLTITLTGAAETSRVSLVAGGTRQPVAQLVAGVPLKLDMNALNIGKGRRVNVNLQGDQVLLIPEGATDPECEAARADASATQCREVAAVTWGTSREVALQSTGGVLSYLAWNATRRLTVGVDYTRLHYLNLDDVACDPTTNPGLESCDPDSGSNALGAFLEYRVSDHFSLGIRGSHTSYAVRQTIADEAPVRHEVSLGMYDLFGRYDVRSRGALRPWGMLGASFFNNSSDVMIDDDVADTRSESGLRLIGGIGLDLAVGDRVAARGGLRYGAGGGGDADGHYGYGIGLTFNF